MIKIIKYFFQSILVYLFFFIGFILGIKLSREIFANLFSIIGPVFKSKKIIKNNLEIFSSYSSNIDAKKISKNMWRNYGMTFIEYIFLKQLRKNKTHISINGENILNEIIKNKK